MPFRRCTPGLFGLLPLESRQSLASLRQPGAASPSARRFPDIPRAIESAGGEGRPVATQGPGYRPCQCARSTGRCVPARRIHRVILPPRLALAISRPFLLSATPKIVPVRSGRLARSRPLVSQGLTGPAGLPPDSECTYDRLARLTPELAIFCSVWLDWRCCVRV